MICLDHYRIPCNGMISFTLITMVLVLSNMILEVVGLRRTISVISAESWGFDIRSYDGISALYIHIYPGLDNSLTISNFADLRLVRFPISKFT